jgi:anti-sigma-K factor RskA
MTDAGEQKRDRDYRAAELALGLLSGADRAEAERELLRDPAFRAAHALWVAKADQWLEQVPPTGDGADLWPAIEAAIDGERGTSGMSSEARPAARGYLFEPLVGLTALHFYQREAAARHESAAIAQKMAQAEGERRVAQISGEASRVLVSALYDPASGTIDLKLELPSEPRQVPELWVIPGDGKPRSRGTFSTATAQIRVDGALRPLLTDGATLAVTMEPADGVLHSAPTGPILGVTQLKAL